MNHSNFLELEELGKHPLQRTRLCKVMPNHSSPTHSLHARSCSPWAPWTNATTDWVQLHPTLLVVEIFLGWQNVAFKVFMWYVNFSSYPSLIQNWGYTIEDASITSLDGNLLYNSITIMVAASTSISPIHHIHNLQGSNKQTTKLNKVHYQTHWKYTKEK